MSGNLHGQGSIGNATFGLEVNIKPLQQGLAAAEQYARQSSTNIQTALADLSGAQATSRRSTQAVNEISVAEVRAATDAAAARRAQATAERELAQAQQESARAIQGVTSGLLGGGTGGNLLGGALGGLLTGAELGVGLAALNALSAGFHDVTQAAVGFNAELQQDAVRLETFTGSLRSAQDDLKRLQDLASSPAGGGFQFQDLEKGEEILQRFGQANENVRRMVADVAAGTGQSYAQIAQLIGEMYDRMDNGLPVARTVLTLERAGIITGDYARQLDEATKAGASNAEINDLITASLQRYQGAADDLGRTAPSRFNEIKASLAALAQQASEPIFDKLAADLGKVSDALKGDNVKQFTKNVHDLSAEFAAGGFKQVFQEFSIMVGETLVIALNEFNDFLKGISHGKINIDGAVKALYDDIADAKKPLDEKVKDFLDHQDTARKAGADTGQAFKEGLEQERQTSMAEIDFLTPDQFTGFDAIIKQVKDYFAKQSKEGEPLQMPVQVEPLVAELISGQGDLASVNEQLKQLLGTDEYNAVLKLVDGYRQLAADSAAVKVAQGSVAETTKALADVQAEAKTKIGEADDALKAAQETMRLHDQAQQQAMQGIRNQINDVEREQQRVDAGFQTTIDKLQTQQKALQDASKERQRQGQIELQQQQELLNTLNEQLKHDRDAASTHADAFKAIEQGTLDIFYQEHDAIDETTRKIIDRYQAEIDGAERAKAATEDKAGNLEADQRRQLLALDERIQTARENNRTGELAALEAERKAYVEKSQPQIDLERERAAVAKDDYDRRVKDIQRAADHQAAADKAKESADQKAVDQQQQKIKGIQDAQKAQQEADQQALDNLNQQIQQVQEEKKQRDLAFAARKQDLDDEQQRIERNGQAQHAADQQAVNDAQTHYNAVKKEWDDREAAAKRNKEIADATLKAAQDQEKADKDDLQHIKDKITALDQFYKDHPPTRPGNIDPGATPGPGGDHPTPQDWQTVPPVPQPPDPRTPHVSAARPLFAPASSVQASAPQVNVNIHNPVIADVVGANQVKTLVAEGVQQGLAQQAAADRAMFTDIVRGGTPAGALIGA